MSKKTHKTPKIPFVTSSNHTNASQCITGIKKPAFKILYKIYVKTVKLTALVTYTSLGLKHRRDDIKALHCTLFQLWTSNEFNLAFCFHSSMFKLPIN